MEGFLSTFWFILINGVLCAESVIHLFRHCEEEIVIGNNVKQSLEISGMEWPSTLYACPVTFRSSGKFDLVYYEFQRFDVNNDDIEVSLQASSEKTEGFKNQGVFGAMASPPMSTVRTASRYFRLMVTRGRLSSYDFSVLLKLYAKEPEIRRTVPDVRLRVETVDKTFAPTTRILREAVDQPSACWKHTSREPHAGAQGTSLKSGQIVGIVIGSIVFILILITLIVCCAIGAKYPDRRGSIYTVARRLSIFATATSQTSANDVGDVSEEEQNSPKKNEDVGQVNEGYPMK